MEKDGAEKMGESWQKGRDGDKERDGEICREIYIYQRYINKC